jgi:hypothetical protein
MLRQAMLTKYHLICLASFVLQERENREMAQNDSNYYNPRYPCYKSILFSLFQMNKIKEFETLPAGNPRWITSLQTKVSLCYIIKIVYFIIFTPNKVAIGTDIET